jgi:hypothetical protein
MDDFSIFGDSFDVCLTNLEKVLSRCEEKNLVLNREKCHFMVTNGTVLTLFYRKELRFFFFFGKLTYVLKEEDTNIIRGIPQIYNDNRNIKQQMATG